MHRPSKSSTKNRKNKRKRSVMTAWLVLVSMLLLPLNGLGKTPDRKAVCPFEDWPNRCFVPGLQKGEPSPFEGDLFTIDYAIWLHQEADAVDDRVAAAVTATASAYKADLKYHDELCEIDRSKVAEVHAARVEMLESQIPSWYEKPAILILGTATVSAIVVTLFYVVTGLGDKIRDEVRGVQ